jgi:hypothetical protein
MRASLPDVLLVNAINGSSIAVLTLNDVKDVVAIVLGIVSILSTLLIIRDNLRKRREANDRGTESTEKKREFRPRIRLFNFLFGALF